VLRDVSDLLACPVCGRGFTLRPTALRCASGHSFDIARQGYVNLLPGGARPGTADTAEMVAARQAFLTAGHYAPLAGAIADLAAATVAAGPRPCVLDAGSGPGYYLAAVLDRLAGRPSGPADRPAEADRPSEADWPAETGARLEDGTGPVGLAMDISARALRRAARAHPAIGAVGWDTWRPFPVRDAVMSLVLDVFAPRNAAEFRRVLRDDGALIVVTPGPGHLTELTGPAGLLAVDERKDERLAASLGAHFTLARDQELSLGLRLTRAEARALAGMGPSARHAGPDGGGRLAARTEPITVTAAFRIACYRPAEPHPPGPENGVNAARPRRP
jgi:23S rRNA (guanine745-N1)-methyltransferase